MASVSSTSVQKLKNEDSNEDEEYFNTSFDELCKELGVDASTSTAARSMLAQLSGKERVSHASLFRNCAQYFVRNVFFAFFNVQK